MDTLLSFYQIFAQGDIADTLESLRTLIFSIAAVLCLGALIVGAIAFMRGDIAVGFYSLIGAGVLAAGWLIVKYLFEQGDAETILF